VTAANELIRTMARQRWIGLDAVGIVTPDGESDAREGGVPVVGRRSDLTALCERHGADDVIIVSDDSWQDRVIDAFSRWPGRRARLLVVPSPYEILIGRTEHLQLHDIPMLRVLGAVPGGSERATKRIVDVLLALVLLALTAPVMAAVWLLVRLTSAGPVVFQQERIGRDREPFTIYKFRTMHERAEAATGPVLAIENDPRATRIGRVLRATRLDELPQLWNVLRGDMSFVGPRPERPEFVERFEVEVPAYAERFKIRPGLTGYAQVNGEYHSAPATKLQYDLAYMYNRTLWLDLKILADTARMMLTRPGV
jgi:exopolysaccharide biosynthesis polyprenyl glycosylphosphotransferase